MESRIRGKKLTDNKLSALEKLKRARQGEKIEEDQEVEEELYEYVDENEYDEDDYEEEETVSKSKPKSSRSKHLAKDKLAQDETAAANKGADIRKAFFKAANHSQKQTKSETKTLDEDDDIANEIMKELNQNKKPTTSATKPKPKQIPFSVNAPSPCISLSPAYKRKLSPSQQSQAASNDSVNRAKKRFELDESASAPRLSDVSNQIEIKSEPVEIVVQPQQQSSCDADDLALINSLIKQETNTSSESFENIDFLNQINEMTLSTEVKQEACMNDTSKNLANSDKFVFYWLDAHEDQSVVYLFGKTATLNASNQVGYVSTCVVVKNIPRVMYVLPRRGFSVEQVTAEIQSILARNKITNYKTRSVKKFYAFDKLVGKNKTDLVPYESEYLQVEYLAKQQLPQEIEGDSFECVFGTQTSCLEQFLVSMKLKGPCWLKISNSAQNNVSVSWCKLEYTCDDYRNQITIYRDLFLPDNQAVAISTTPPLTILTLLTRTMLNNKTHEHEIICACGLVSNKFYLDKATTASGAKMQQGLYEQYFCALTKPSNGTFPYDLQTVLKQYSAKFKIELCGSERALLAYLLCKIQSLDVDVVIGHDLFNFNLDIILNRCLNKKVPHWSRLGRLKRSQVPNLNHNTKLNGATNNLIIQQRLITVCSGRLLCDIMLSSKELLTKCKSYDLLDLAQFILFKNAEEHAILDRNLDEEKQSANYYNSSNLLMKYLGLAMTDANYIMKISNDLQCLQLAYQITCIAGNVLSRTLIGGRSERNEFLLLHAFYDKDFILPDKYKSYSKKSKQKQVAGSANATLNNKSVVKVELKLELEDDEMEDESRLVSATATQLDDDLENKGGVTKVAGGVVSKTNGYTGGLVLEPKVGFYDRFILLLDFNSLYPSIIQEYNICFTTINRPFNEMADTDIDEYLDQFIKLPTENEKPGILPLEIRKLVDSRRQVKQLMQDKNLSADLRMQYDIRQKALKLTANSVYGCLGFENSRFYCKPLAALITKNGRSILMKTKELVENKKIEVIYGDTDSIMINTNLNDYESVIKLGNMLKQEVNKFYKHLEIDIDGVFKSLLLLRKKKYAALTVQVNKGNVQNPFTYQKEIKGLDIVRRDWCLLAKQIGEKVISEILSGQNCDTVLTNINKILTDTADKIKNNSFDLKLFEISKQLNKNPEDYGDSNHQSHVIVALRHNKDLNNNKKYKSGNVISYIICEDGTQNSSTQRAYSVSELLKSPENLKLDYRYYLTQQIHPVVTRLCEPIDGIDAFYVAQSLGLDPTGFRHKSASASSVSNNLALPAPQSRQQKKLENYMNELDKYNSCQPFKYICPECKSESVWSTPFVKQTSSNSDSFKQEPMEPEEDEDIQIDGINIVKTSSNKVSNNSFKCILDSCSNPKCKLKPASKLAYIKNCLHQHINKFIKQYYQAWLVCEDPMCSHRTKRISCKFFNGKPQCIECEKYSTVLEYSHSDLYYQMKFYKLIFDSDSYKMYFKDDSADITNMLRNNKEAANGLNQLKEIVSKSLKTNAYGLVDLNNLFKKAF